MSAAPAAAPPASSSLAGAPALPHAKRLRMPLAAKLAVALIGLVTLVLIVNGAINLWLSYNEAKNSAISVQQEKARAAAERIGQFVSEIESQMGWTTRAEWRRVPPEQQRYDFIRLLRQTPAITEISYIDPAGKEQLKVSRLEPDSVGSQADYSGEPRFVKAVAEKAWFGPVYFRRGSEPYMTLAVAHAGRNPGVTVAEVNLKLIWDVITAIRVGEKGHAFVVNSQGRLIAHPDLSLVLRDTDLSRLPQVTTALAEASGKTSTAEIVTGLDGSRVLSANAPIGRVGWLVFVQLPVEEALAPVYTSLAQTAALLGLGLLLATVVGSLLARRMAVPIRRLQAGAERLGAGDLSQRMVIRTGDEIETLAERFNVMASRIQESYETLEAKVDERTRDLNESLHQQTATAEVLKVISRSAFDLQVVLETLTQSAARLCEADMAGIVRPRDGTDRFFHVTSYNFSDEAREIMKVAPIGPDRGSVVGRAMLDKGAVHVPDVTADPDYTYGAIQRVAGYRTILSVPFLREGEPVGALFLSRRVVRPFTERQIQLVKTFADQAVIAIENARLFEEVQARTRELSESLEYQTATGEVLGVISRSPSQIEPVLDAILRTAERLCESEYALLFRPGEDGRYHLSASNNASTAYVRYASDHPLNPDRGSLVGRTAVEGRTVHLADCLEDPEYKAFGYQEIGRHRSMLGVPLLREGTVIGVIALLRTARRPFSPRQIELVTTFADQAVIAINNVGLFEEVQARTRELSEALQQQTATSEVLQAISRSTFELDFVLDTLVHSAAKLCDSEIGTITRRKDGLFYRAALYGFPEEFAREASTMPVEIDDGTVTGRALKDARIIHIPDVLSDPDYSWTEAQAAVGYRTLLGVPLLREGSPIGAFALGRRTVQPYTGRQIELVKTFADQAVIAIENARLFEEVQARTRELSQSLEDLQKAQDRLVQSEKLASLGQLTAGIAHEIKNPLNFVNNFSSLSAELLDELREMLEPAALDKKTSAGVVELMDMLKGNLEKVVQHGKRADSIVKNMLLHSREGSGERRFADVNAIVEESMNLAYHGARAEKPGFNITLQKDLDPAAGQADLYAQEVTRVLLNLFSNGFYATAKRKAETDGAFEPTMRAATRNLGDRVEIRIRDNGTGIPEEVAAKMFNPFFTTKPAGEGTGLGLSLSYDIIVKQHGGTIEVATAPGEFTEFIITLPRSGPPNARTEPS